jgi:fermentation-respiration switch protein FrsA (DUF1100 family)
LILVHGRDDALIPYTESQALTLAAGVEKTDLFIIDSLQHIELELSGISDLSKIWRATYLLLRERDRMPPPRAVLKHSALEHSVCLAAAE